MFRSLVRFLALILVLASAGLLVYAFVETGLASGRLLDTMPIILAGSLIALAINSNQSEDY